MTDTTAAIMQWVDPDADRSLPAWTYADADFHAVEIERIFRPSWQIVCHESDVPAPGDYHLLDYIGESVVVLRGSDKRLRAFANVCRHRGSTGRRAAPGRSPALIMHGATTAMAG